MDGFDEKDEILIRYLLSEQSKEQNEDLEDEMSLEPALAERMQVVEMNLIDSYILNQLSHADKARFEKGFFLFPENRSKVNDARVFHESLRPQTQVTHEGLRVASPRFAPAWMPLFLRAPVPAFGIAALILITVLILGTFIILKKSGRVLTNNSQVQKGQQSPRPSINGNEGSTEPSVAEASPTPTNLFAKQPPISGKNARANTFPRNDLIASVDEIGLTVSGVTRGANSGDAGAQALLLKIPKDAKHFILEVKLKPHEYLAKNLNCSVAISDSESRVHYPKGEGNYLKVSVSRVEGQFPYQVSIRVPTNFLRERKLYYLTVLETEKVTPFKVKFVS